MTAAIEAAPAVRNAETPLRELARESFFPRTRLARVALAVAVGKPLLIWLLPRLIRNEPLAVTALYRPSGDIQYYEIVAALAQGNFGECNVAELAGQGVQAFPFVPVLLHALAFGVLGIWGLLLADVAVSWAFFGALVLMLRLSRLGPAASSCLSLAVAASLPTVVSVVTERMGLPFLMWGDRLPRPFVAELLLVGALAVNAAMVSRRDRPPDAGFWVVAGVTAALLVQSDVFGAFIVLCLHAATFTAVIVGADSVARAKWVRGAAVGVIALAVTAVPFVLQRLRADPDLAQRFGAFPVSRATALSWARHMPLLPVVTVLVMGAALLVARRRAGAVRRALAWSDDVGLVILSWMVATAIAWLALPVFCAILGQAIQIYHFQDRLSRIASYALTLFAAHALLVVARAWPRSETLGRKLAPVAGTALVLASVAAIGLRGWTNARRTSHVRATYFAYEALGPYRPAFAELVDELQQPLYGSADVLGTFDHQVHVAWQAFRGGHSFVPDLFVSTVKDEEAEVRVAALCKLLGMDEERFVAFVQEGWVNTFWIGLAKYAANSGHMFSGPEDYEPAQVATAGTKGIFNAWNLAIPRSELGRLRATYRDVQPAGVAGRRLDVIVLTNDTSLGQFEPDPRRFRRTFENRVFRVYVPAGD